MNPRKRAQLRERVKRAAAHLDDVTLDRAFEFALQGDMVQVEKRLGSVATTSDFTRTFTWRETSSWLFNRRTFSDRDPL